MNFEQAIEILAAFQREQVRYVLIGSMAMAAHGLIRATQDADFFVAADDENVGRLKRALHSIFHDPTIEDITSADLSGSFPVVRYGPPESDFVIDFISRVGEAFAFDDVEWEDLSIEGVIVRVATPKMLYLMKRRSLRPQDQVDADRLQVRFGLEG